MGILFASILALLVVEYFFKLPFFKHTRTLKMVVNKSIHVVLSKRVSDHWKEIILLRYARELAIHTVVIALMLVGAVPLVILPAFILDLVFAPNPSTIESLSSLAGLSTMTIVSLLYMAFRNHVGNS